MKKIFGTVFAVIIVIAFVALVFAPEKHGTEESIGKATSTFSNKERETSYFAVACIVLIAGFAFSVFGMITGHTLSNKGYKNGFWLGFFFNFFGIFISLLMPYKSQNQKTQVISEQSPADMLRQLADLHQQGILTEEEYQGKKKEVLGQWK